MRVENPSPSELRAHQIAYYTQLLNESKSDGQKRFLKTQLYNLKKHHHGNRNRVGPGSIVHVMPVFDSKVLSLN